MIGDFNESMWSFEHFSKTRWREQQMMDFRLVLSYCDLHDLGFSGLLWTYNNKQQGDHNVRVRLDRAVASPAWSSRVVHLKSSRSDHCPLLQLEVGNRDVRIKWCMRYEIMWERVDSLPETIKQAWQMEATTFDLHGISSKLKAVMKTLKSWSRENFWILHKRVRIIKG